MDKLKQILNDLSAPFRQRVDKKALDNQLLRYRDAVIAYQEQKVPAGHEHYQRLLDMSLKAIAEYAETWDVPVVNLHMEYAFLEELKSLAEGKEAKGFSPVFAIWAVAVLIVLFGMVPAVINAVYQWTLGKLT